MLGFFMLRIYSTLRYFFYKFTLYRELKARNGN